MWDGCDGKIIILFFVRIRMCVLHMAETGWEREWDRHMHGVHSASPTKAINILISSNLIRRTRRRRVRNERKKKKKCIPCWHRPPSIVSHNSYCIFIFHCETETKRPTERERAVEEENSGLMSAIHKFIWFSFCILHKTFSAHTQRCTGMDTRREQYLFGLSLRIYINFSLVVLVDNSLFLFFFRFCRGASTPRAFTSFYGKRTLRNIEVCINNGASIPLWLRHIQLLLSLSLCSPFHRSRVVVDVVVVVLCSCYCLTAHVIC